MKKVTLLALAAALCLVSCDDSDGSKAGKYNFDKPASEQQVNDIVKAVSDNAAKTNAKPGSKEYCEAISDALKDAEELNMTGIYSDALNAQVAALKKQIEECTKDKTKGESLDWYQDTVKEAAKEAKNDDDIIKKLAEMTREGMEIDKSFDGDCKALEAKYAAFQNKYASLMDAMEAMDESMSDDEMEKFIIKLVAETGLTESEIEAVDAKEMEIEAKCGGISYGSDPCDKMSCDLMKGEICMDGQCVDLCGIISCPSGTTCSAGFCMPTIKTCLEDPSVCTKDQECNEVGACVPKDGVKTCTDDPSICGKDKECKAGVCVEKAPVVVDDNICAKFTKTEAAYKSAIKNLSTCEKLQKDEAAVVKEMIGEGLDIDDDDMLEGFYECIEKWNEDLVKEIGEAALEDKYDKIDWKTCDSEFFGDEGSKEGETGTDDDVCESFCAMDEDKEECIKECKELMEE